jgi:hypothetical protein
MCVNTFDYFLIFFLQFQNIILSLSPLTAIDNFNKCLIYEKFN